MIDPQLTNKVALITGANHGIGAATARLFAARLLAHMKIGLLAAASLAGAWASAWAQDEILARTFSLCRK
jgi:NAD(P)-dependent dehydrogenase (short-subunit alcohol dehydrogenase family)